MYIVFAYNNYVDVFQADVDNAVGKGSSRLQTALLGRACIKPHICTLVMYAWHCMLMIIRQQRSESLPLNDYICT